MHITLQEGVTGIAICSIIDTMAREMVRLMDSQGKAVFGSSFMWAEGVSEWPVEYERKNDYGNCGIVCVSGGIVYGCLCGICL